MSGSDIHVQGLIFSRDSRTGITVMGQTLSAPKLLDAIQQDSLHEVVQIIDKKKATATSKLRSGNMACHMAAESGSVELLMAIIRGYSLANRLPDAEGCACASVFTYIHRADCDALQCTNELRTKLFHQRYDNGLLERSRRDGISAPCCKTVNLPRRSPSYMCVQTRPYPQLQASVLHPINWC